jgi:hypothetical protein
MHFIPYMNIQWLEIIVLLYCVTEVLFVICHFTDDKYMYRIMAVLKVETDIITSFTESLIGWAMMMYIETFKTDVIVFIGNIIMCLMSQWPINLSIMVSSWSVHGCWHCHSVRSKEKCKNYRWKKKKDILSYIYILWTINCFIIMYSIFVN